MRAATSPAAFVRAPAGSWALAGTSLLWCASDTLCGVVCWGRPGGDDARAALRLYDAMASLAPRFDVLLDASALDGLDAEAMTPFLGWVSQHLTELSRRIRRRVGLVPSGIPGLTLAGITPTLGGPGPYTLVSSPRDGFRQLLPAAEADALCAEVTALTLQARGASPALLALQSLLRTEAGRLDLDSAAHQLHVSRRTLQRELTACGSSYRAEQQRARFLAAESRLRTTEKVSSIAEALGLSDGALTTLVRSHTGLTPGEYRRKLRD